MLELARLRNKERFCQGSKGIPPAAADDLLSHHTGFGNETRGDVL
jgi:hypothetical protein